MKREEAPAWTDRHQRRDSDKRHCGRAAHPPIHTQPPVCFSFPAAGPDAGARFDDTCGIKVANCYVSLQSPDPYLQVARILMMAAMNAVSDAPGWAVSSSLQVDGD
jgi:hypothetical protein